MQQIPLLITPKYWAPPYNVWSPGRPGPRHLCFHPPPPRSALHYDNTWLRVQYMALLVTIHGTACYNTWHFLLQYMALLVTIHGTSCYNTWHFLLQYMTLLVTIHGTSCYNTWHFLLQYMALLVIQLHICFPKFASQSVVSVRIFFSAPPLPCSLSLCSSLRWRQIFFFIQSNEQNFGLYEFCIDFSLQQNEQTLKYKACRCVGALGCSSIIKFRIRCEW